MRHAIAGRDGWQVKDEIHIGIFQFYKLRMYRDLVDNLTLASSHDVISTLATPGAVWSHTGDMIPDDFDFDREVHPEETFRSSTLTPVKWESSSRYCVGRPLLFRSHQARARARRSQMPSPSSARGKTVLFVSEKSAALEVVHKRLESAGLADLTLALHSHKANKSEIIGQLYRSMERVQSRSANGDDRFDAAAVEFSART